MTWSELPPRRRQSDAFFHDGGDYDHMGISVVQLGATLLLTLLVVIVVVSRRGRTVWLLLLPLSFAVAMVATPADPASFVLIWLFTALRLPAPTWVS